MHDEASGSRGKHRRGRRERAWAGGFSSLRLTTSLAPPHPSTQVMSEEFVSSVINDMTSSTYLLFSQPPRIKLTTSNHEILNLSICVMEGASHRPAFQFVHLKIAIKRGLGVVQSAVAHSNHLGLCLLASGAYFISFDSMMSE